MRATTENDAIPITIYRPNNDFKTPGTRSPEDVQLFTAATTAQGLAESLMHRIRLHPLSQSPTLKAAVPIAPAVAGCGIGKRRATMPTAISSASTGRRCITRKSLRASKMAKAVSSSNACVFPESAIPIPMTISLCSSNAGFGKHRRFRHRSFSVPQCSITVPGADARSGRGYHRRSLDGVTPEIIDRTRGRCVNSSNKWGKNWRTHE